MVIMLTAIDRPIRGQSWALELQTGLAVLRAPSGQTLDSIPLEHAGDRLQLRWGGRLSILVGDQVIRFALRGRDRRRLRQLTGGTRRAPAPQTLSDMRARATRNVAIGLTSATLAVILAGSTWLDATLPAVFADPARLGIVIGAALLLILGMSAVGMGMHGISHYAQLKQLGR